MENQSRRNFLRATGLAALAGASGAAASAGVDATGSEAHYRFFNPAEAAFVEAAVARLIPADDLGPGAVEAGVHFFIDQQLGGAWGSGERLYRSGPWQAGSPSQGYQLPFTPAELFRNAIRAVDADLTRTHARPFARLSHEAQDAYLASLEKGDRELDGVPAKVFFESLLELTIEGYFSDPVYGGNRNMAAWEMIGFPGAYATYYDLVDRHGMDFRRRPMSLAENGAGRVHLHPDIPAYVSPERK